MKGTRLVSNKKRQLLNKANYWYSKLSKLGLNTQELNKSTIFGKTRLTDKTVVKFNTKQLTGYLSELARFYYAEEKTYTKV